jgi:hypothetical protein
MKERCYNKNNKSYNDYGGRGIKVCDEWKNDVNAFVKWAIDNGYKEDLTIDRIDVNGDYCPENCRWVTMKEQGNNKRKNHLITYNGKIQTLSQWCDELNLNRNMVAMRLFRGWDFERIVSTPKKQWTPENMIGKKYGKLTVLELCNERTKEGRYKYICKCDCGNIATVSGKLLRSGHTKSCGCICKEKASKLHKLQKII